MAKLKKSTQSFLKAAKERRKMIGPGITPTEGANKLRRARKDFGKKNIRDAILARFGSKKK